MVRCVGLPLFSNRVLAYPITSHTAVANYYLTFSIIITIVGTSLRSPNDIAGGDPDTIKCWSGSFLQDDSGNSFDWLGLVK